MASKKAIVSSGADLCTTCPVEQATLYYHCAEQDTLYHRCAEHFHLPTPSIIPSSSFLFFLFTSTFVRLYTWLLSWRFLVRPMHTYPHASDGSGKRPSRLNVPAITSNLFGLFFSYASLFPPFEHRRSVSGLHQARPGSKRRRMS